MNKNTVKITSLVFPPFCPDYISVSLVIFSILMTSPSLSISPIIMVFKYSTNNRWKTLIITISFKIWGHKVKISSGCTDWTIQVLQFGYWSLNIQLTKLCIANEANWVVWMRLFLFWWSSFFLFCSLCLLFNEISLLPTKKKPSIICFKRWKHYYKT